MADHRVSPLIVEHRRADPSSLPRHHPGHQVSSHRRDHARQMCPHVVGTRIEDHPVNWPPMRCWWLRHRNRRGHGDYVQLTPPRPDPSWAGPPKRVTTHGNVPVGQKPACHYSMVFLFSEFEYPI
jgi:hypothetical protein